VTARRKTLVLGLVALSGGALGACGGDNTYIDSIPKSTPGLTVPPNAVALPGVQTTSTTSTTGTTTTGTATTPGTSTGTAAPVTPTQTPQSGGTPSGGTQTPQSTTTPSSGGTPAGGFSDFCKQNPGACGQ
jgi:hypothetical protein